MLLSVDIIRQVFREEIDSGLAEPALSKLDELRESVDRLLASTGNSPDEILIRQGFTDKAARRFAKAVGYAEAKGWDPAGAHFAYTDAVGDLGIINDEWGPSVGWFQVRSLRDPQSGNQADLWRIAFALLHPDYNARAAYVISKGGTDFSLWSTWKNETYKQFLDLDYELRTGHVNALRWNA
jgi:hypothetical protein